MKITLIMAMTLDGKIAKNSDHFPDWTCKEDKKMFADISKESGVVLMGEKTFKTFPCPLKDRLNVVFTQEENPAETEGVRWASGNIEKVVQELEDDGYKSAILGGGAFLNTQFLKQKMIDEIIITVEPKIFGQGISLFGEEFETDLKLLEIIRLNDDSLALKYKVIR